MEIEKHILQTSEVLQDALKSFDEEGFSEAFKGSYARAGVFFDLFWEQSNKNGIFSHAFNAFARMKFIEQFLKESEAILSDAVRFRLRDHYKNAAYKLATYIIKKETSEFVSESAVEKEVEKRYKAIYKGLSKEQKVELDKAVNKGGVVRVELEDEDLQS